MQRNEIEAMSIICNIQAMQKTIHGQHFEHASFNANTVDELRDLQSSLIPEYNAALERNTTQLAAIGKISTQIAQLAYDIGVSIDDLVLMIVVLAKQKLTQQKKRDQNEPAM